MTSLAAANELSSRGDNGHNLLGRDIENQTEALINKFQQAPRLRFSFYLQDIKFEALSKRQANGAPAEELQIYGELAYMPYSAENYEKRQTLLSLLRQMEQPRLSFSLHVTPQQKIVVRARYPFQHLRPPDYIFHPIVQFSQEVTPFLDLVRRYI